MSANDKLNDTIKTYKHVVINKKKLEPAQNPVKTIENGADLLQSIIDAPMTSNTSYNEGTSFDDLQDIFSQITPTSTVLTSNTSDLLQPMSATTSKIDDGKLLTDFLPADVVPATVETLLKNHNANKPRSVFA